MKFPGEVKKGKLLIDAAALAIALREFEGRRVVVEIEREKSIRSVRANARYWTILIPLAGDLLQKKQGRVLPYSKEQVHWIIKSAFLGCEDNPLGGPPVPLDSHTLSTEEFYNFTEEVSAWLAQNGYPIPVQGEQLMESA